MQFTITQSQSGLTRIIDVAVKADPGKRLSRVRTTYDGFVLGDDPLQPPASTYERQFSRTQGITPNQQHTVIVEAWHTDGSADAGRKTWTD